MRAIPRSDHAAINARPKREIITLWLLMKGRALGTADKKSEVQLKVFIVDDHAVVRRSVRTFLEVHEDLRVVAEAANGQEALDKIDSMAAHGGLPDVVLMDLLMPKMDGVTATALITRRHPTVHVLVLTSFGDMERVHAALDNGASGYLLKDAEPGEVVAAIRAAASGGLSSSRPRLDRSNRRRLGANRAEGIG
jgi:DNA-binding NarL/FixJ family response regulator